MHSKRVILIISLSIYLPLCATSQSVNDSETPNYGQSFKPDYIFKESDLDDWHTIGKAEWTAENGEITGNASSGNGWLVLNKSYQDVGFHSLFKCTSNCETGVIFRMEETEDGYTGVFMSLKQDDVMPYRVMLNEEGIITSRKLLGYAGGISYRVAPMNKEYDGGESSRTRNTYSPPTEPEVDRPIAEPNTQFRKGEWNQIESFLDVNVIRSFLNDGDNIGGHVGSTNQQRTGLDGYGPIALYIGGQGEVRFRELMYKDIAIRITPKEKSSPRFEVLQISDMYYSWGTDTADFNRDGVIDIVAGPYIYFGPEYITHREIFPAITGSPSNEFPYNRVQHAYDFDNDGWPDILATTFGNTRLYMNPEGESRRWASYGVLPDVQQGEITDFVDIDGDGRPELIYSAGGTVRYAKPGADPTVPWVEYIISEQGYGTAHGIGTGDINGDGRVDILNAFGWWEQPEEIEQEKLWKYHQAALGRYGRRAGGMGGTLMAVYDVNGNGLNDVVTNLNAHGFGFAWFEQKRDENGAITFTRHMISDDYSTENAGDVTFSQPHGATFADIDQDGIQDFIVGKRYWSHMDNYLDPDPYSPPVLYWYKTVRDSEAPGGARFEPELIHNRSGAGSEVTAVDINQDGAVDIITSTNRGTFIFWNTPDD